jgi:hypothetical protein
MPAAGMNHTFVVFVSCRYGMLSFTYSVEMPVLYHALLILDLGSRIPAPTASDPALIPSSARGRLAAPLLPDGFGCVRQNGFTNHLWQLNFLQLAMHYAGVDMRGE